MSPLFLLVVSSYIRQTQQTPTTCVIEEFPRIRTFSTLEEYQGNKKSFNPYHMGYAGNVVNFSFEKLETIPKNAFISFGSSSIVELHLNNKEIKEINPGAFVSLECLNELDLSHNYLVDVSEGVFQDLDNLQNLLLNDNHLTTTPDGGMALLNLRKLKLLDLSKNRIGSLKRIAFDSLTNLTTLRLGQNQIRTIEDTVFSPLTSLEILLLNDNLLLTIEPHKWQNLNQLSTLDLSNNFLQSFDTGYNFSFSHLKTLNLSGNFFTLLDGYGIKNAFKELDTLDIGNNPWICKDLNDFKSSLVGSKIHLPPTVKCDKEKRANWSIPTPRPDTSEEDATNKTLDVAHKVEEIEDVVRKENTIGHGKLIDKVSYIQKFLTVITVLAIMCCCTVLFVKLQVWQTLYSRCGNRQSEFIDDNLESQNGHEYYRLVGR